MAFIKKIEYEESKSKFRRTEFLSLPTGTSSTIRILEEEAVLFKTHYLSGYTIKCSGEDCPLCVINRELIMQYPETFRDDARFVPQRNRYYVNVLDKTPAKHCDSCGSDTKDLSQMVCFKCKRSTALVDATPINQVKVLAKGPTLFNMLDDVNSAVLVDPSDPNSELVGISNFDITLVIRGTGLDTTTTPIANPSANAVVNLSDYDDLFDLDEAIISLEPSEVLELQSGVSLKDIFIARSANKPQEEKVATVSNSNIELDSDAVNAEFKEQMESRVKGLFGRK